PLRRGHRRVQRPRLRRPHRHRRRRVAAHRQPPRRQGAARRRRAQDHRQRPRLHPGHLRLPHRRPDRDGRHRQAPLHRPEPRARLRRRGHGPPHRLDRAALRRRRLRGCHTDPGDPLRHREGLREDRGALHGRETVRHHRRRRGRRPAGRRGGLHRTGATGPPRPPRRHCRAPCRPDPGTHRPRDPLPRPRPSPARRLAHRLRPAHRPPLRRRGRAPGRRAPLRHHGRPRPAHGPRRPAGGRGPRVEARAARLGHHRDGPRPRHLLRRLTLAAGRGRAVDWARSPDRHLPGGSSAMHRLRTAFVLAFFALTAASPGHAQPAARAAASTFELSVANIMRGPEHVGSPPTAIRWTDDSRWIYFRWKPGGRPWHEEPALYRVPASGGTPERLSDEAADSLGVLLATGDISPDERWRVVAYEGDLWLIDRRSLAVRRLTHTRTAESNPVFGHDGRTIYFVQENNVFSMSLDGGSVRQLTDIRAGSPPEERQAAGQRRFLAEQQKELFEHTRREVERRDGMRRRREAREARNVKTVYISPEERVQAIAPEPGGRYAVLHVYKPARDARRTIVPDYVTASGYTENIDARAKVGDAQSEARLGLVDLSTGDVRWLELGTATAASQPADSTTRARSAKPRLAAARFLGWNRDGTLGLIGAVSYDFKDQWLHVLDAATGEVRIVAHDHDDAWIGGPC